jgi:hypothetical protein
MGIFFLTKSIKKIPKGLLSIVFEIRTFANLNL